MDYCLATGTKHPDLIFDELSWNQWLDWMAFAEVAPFGDRRADARMAVLYWANLAPWSESADRPPNVTWPYFDVEDVWDELETIAQTAALEAFAKALADGKENRNQPTVNPLGTG